MSLDPLDLDDGWDLDSGSCAGHGLHLSTLAWILALTSSRTSALLVLTCGAVRSASQGICLWSSWVAAGRVAWCFFSESVAVLTWDGKWFPVSLLGGQAAPYCFCRGFQVSVGLLSSHAIADVPSSPSLAIDFADLEFAVRRRKWFRTASSRRWSCAVYVSLQQLTEPCRDGWGRGTRENAMLDCGNVSIRRSGRFDRYTPSTGDEFGKAQR